MNMNEKEKWNKFWKHAYLGVTPTRKNLFKRFEEIKLSESAKILDVGCGSGTLANFWKEQGYDVTGLDMSDRSLEITSRKGVHYVKGDVTKSLPFEDNTFELVYSDGLLEHFIYPKPVLEEIFRVSKKYVLTMVPRICLYVWLINIIFRPPKEYKKKEDEWVELHRELNPRSVEFEEVRFGILMILCEKGRIV
jgi:ubiquinone/menaquinone biosynthesis C-methylase UbiE